MHVPFDKVVFPGPKQWDMDIDDFSVTPQRAQVRRLQQLLPRHQRRRAGLEDRQRGERHEHRRPQEAAAVRAVQDDRPGPTSRTRSSPTRRRSSTRRRCWPTRRCIAGVCDAELNDLPIVEDAVSKSKGKLEAVGQIQTGDHLGIVFAKGNPLRDQVNQALASMKADGSLAGAAAEVVLQGARRADAPVAPERRAMLRSRGFWISTASTVVFVVVVAVLLLTAPGIHNLNEGLFNVHDMRAALPSVWDGFKINLKMMVIAEVLRADLRPRGRHPAPASRPGGVPVARCRGRLHRRLSRAADNPGRDLHRPRLPGVGPVGDLDAVAVHVRRGHARAGVLRLRRGGLPGRYRVGPPEPDGGGAVARPRATPRRCGS